jgi:hypothetical protein
VKQIVPNPFFIALGAGVQGIKKTVNNFVRMFSLFSLLYHLSIALLSIDPVTRNWAPIPH